MIRIIGVIIRGGTVKLFHGLLCITVLVVSLFFIKVTKSIQSRAVSDFFIVAV